MTTTKPKTLVALQRFEEFHCAQSVVHAFADDTGIDKDTLSALSTGFGVGLGRKQQVCGAVTGAILILGAIYGRKGDEPKNKTEETYREVQRFIDEFIAEKGTIKCSELLPGCDLQTDEGQRMFRENNLKGEVCARCVELACNLLQKHLYQDGKS